MPHHMRFLNSFTSCANYKFVETDIIVWHRGLVTPVIVCALNANSSRTTSCISLNCFFSQLRYLHLIFLTPHLPAVFLFSSLPLLCPSLSWGPSCFYVLDFFHETHKGSQFPSSGPLRISCQDRKCLMIDTGSTCLRRPTSMAMSPFSSNMLIKPFIAGLSDTLCPCSNWLDNHPYTVSCTFRDFLSKSPRTVRRSSTTPIFAALFHPFDPFLALVSPPLLSSLTNPSHGVCI